MITIRILLSPGRRGRVVDASGRSVPQPVPAPVIGSAEPLRIILLDPATLDPADPYGFDSATLRLSIAGDWAPATLPVYVTQDLVRTAAGTYDIADPSGTRTAEAVALLGVLPERQCAWEIAALGGDDDWAHPLSVVQFDAPLRNRADSCGDPSELPPVDIRGPAGPAATVAIGNTTTLAAGSSATVRNVGTENAAIFNFGIPAGPTTAISAPTSYAQPDAAGRVDLGHDRIVSIRADVASGMTGVLVDEPASGMANIAGLFVHNLSTSESVTIQYLGETVPPRTILSVFFARLNGLAPLITISKAQSARP